jgi:arsenite transporter
MADSKIPADGACQKGHDVEKDQNQLDVPTDHHNKESVFKNLGILDRYLAVWIFLAMAIGIILGNFVPSTGRALQKGEFVGVSIPIGTTMCKMLLLARLLTLCLF